MVNMRLVVLGGVLTIAVALYGKNSGETSVVSSGRGSAEL